MKESKIRASQQAFHDYDKLNRGEISQVQSLRIHKAVVGAYKRKAEGLLANIMRIRKERNNALKDVCRYRDAHRREASESQLGFRAFYITFGFFFVSLLVNMIQYAIAVAS